MTTQAPIDRKGGSLKRVLFLCADNFHASRFCEELFNSLARAEGLNWQASSRAVADAPSPKHLNPMSDEAIARLRWLGAAPVNHGRLPLQATTSDLRMANCIVGVDLALHRHRIHDLWPHHAAQIEHWSARDGSDRDGLAALTDGVRCLVAALCGYGARFERLGIPAQQLAAATQQRI